MLGTLPEGVQVISAEILLTKSRVRSMQGIITNLLWSIAGLTGAVAGFCSWMVWYREARISEIKVTRAHAASRHLSSF